MHMRVHSRAGAGARGCLHARVRGPGPPARARAHVQASARTDGQAGGWVHVPRPARHARGDPRTRVCNGAECHLCVCVCVCVSPVGTCHLPCTSEWPFACTCAPGPVGTGSYWELLGALCSPPPRCHSGSGPQASRGRTQGTKGTSQGTGWPWGCWGTVGRFPRLWGGSQGCGDRVTPGGTEWRGTHIPWVTGEGTHTHSVPVSPSGCLQSQGPDWPDWVQTVSLRGDSIPTGVIQSPGGVFLPPRG